MFKNPYFRDACLSMSYLLLCFRTSPIAGWVILLFSLIKFGNLLEEITGTDDYKSDINLLTCLHSVLMTITLFSFLLLFSSRLIDVFVFILYLANALIGIAYIKWGIHLNKLPKSLYKLKRLLVGVITILGAYFIAYGILGTINIFIDNISINIGIDWLSKVYKVPLAFLAITIGLVFLRASVNNAEIC